MAYAVPIATTTGGFGSLPIEFSVYTCTCRGVHRASTCSVYAAPHRYWSTWPSTYAAPFATATGGLNSLPVEPTVYSCTCGENIALAPGYIAPAPAVYAAPAPVMVYLALAQAVSYAAQAQVLEYFAPASSASAGPFATATGSFNLSLSCPPSTLALLVEYIAPAPQWYAAPRLS